MTHQDEVIEPEVTVIHEQSTAVVETGVSGSMPVLQTREDMEAALARMELSVEYQKKFLILALKMTTEIDWCYLGKKFFLQNSGTKKVSRAFGVFVDHGGPVETNRLTDDKGEYVVVSVPMVAYWQGSKASDVGVCSTRDKLYGTVGGGYKPLSEVSMVNVKLKAQTSATRRVINAVLGLNPSEQNMIDAGLDLQKIKDESGVSYNSGSQGGNVDTKELTTKKAEIGKMMVEMYGDKKAASARLEEMTTFTAGDGKLVPGKTSMAKVTAKQFGYVEKDIRKEHAEFLKAQEPKGGGA